jgi:hypothetical protein
VPDGPDGTGQKGFTISYTGVGSGAGRAQLIAGTVDFAGSDTAASADETNQQFQPPADANVTAAIDDATINGDGTLTLNYLTSAPQAYPISTVSCLLVPTRLDANKGDNLKAFLNYILSSAGQAKAPTIGYAALPSKILSVATTQAASINPEVATTSTTVTTAAPTTTTTAKKITATVVPTTAPPGPELARSGRNFGFPVTLGSLLTLAGVALLAESRRARRARRTTG